MNRGHSLAAVLACILLVGTRAWTSAVESIFVDVPPGKCVATGELALTIDGRSVPIANASRGPHPVSAVLLFDISASMPRLSVQDVAKRVSLGTRAGDTIRVATFSPGVIVSRTLLTDERAASLAALEVSQARSLGPSPLWDAIHDSVTSARMASGIRAVLVYTDAMSTGNDRSFDEVHDQTLASSTLISALFDRVRMPKTVDLSARMAALRRLVGDTAGEFVEGQDPAAFCVDMLRILRERCRLDFDAPYEDSATHTVSVTLAGTRVRGPQQIRFADPK